MGSYVGHVPIHADDICTVLCHCALHFLDTVPYTMVIFLLFLQIAGAAQGIIAVSADNGPLSFSADDINIARQLIFFTSTVVRPGPPTSRPTEIVGRATQNATQVRAGLCGAVQYRTLQYSTVQNTILHYKRKLEYRTESCLPPATEDQGLAAAMSLQVTCHLQLLTLTCDLPCASSLVPCDL